MKRYWFVWMVLLMVGLAGCGGGSESASSGGSARTPLSSSKAVTAFDFSAPAATGVINEAHHTISVTVPYGTDVTALVPSITHTGASINPPSGAAQNFSAPVTYTVTAANGSMQQYRVTVFLDPNPSASNYFVSNNGDDDADGQTQATAWKTIARVNANIYQPGDSILFQRGGIWRDGPLLVKSSGNAGNQITYGAYGAGDRPRIYGSVPAAGWTHVSGNIWASAATVPLDPWTIGYNNEGPDIFFEENDGTTTWGVRRDYDAELSNLTAEYHWTWSAGRVYVYSPSDPQARYASVEATQLVRGIMLLDHDYITIDGLSVKYYADMGIYDNYATVELYGLRVTNCEIAYIGRKNDSAGYGLSVHHSDSYYAYNEIHNCGRRGISLTMYGETAPITQSNVVIEHNHFHHGWHTTSLDGCAAGGHILEDVVFRYNRVDGDPDVVLNDGSNPVSNHIYCAFGSAGGGSVRRFYFHNNIFTYAHGSSIQIANIGDFEICNNTFYNFNPTLTNRHAHVYTSTSAGPIIVKNNIFYNNAVDNRWTAIKLTEAYRSLVTIDANLYYQSSSGKRFFWVDGGTSYSVDQWDAYRVSTGFDADSPAPADPLFVNAPLDFRLGSGSPALGSGVAISGITTDYYGNPMNSPPDLGACQQTP